VPPSLVHWLTIAKRRTLMHSDLVVGGRFPDLELPNHLGEPTRISALAGKFPLILTFYRGYW